MTLHHRISPFGTFVKFLEELEGMRRGRRVEAPLAMNDDEEEEEEEQKKDELH